MLRCRRPGTALSESSEMLMIVGRDMIARRMLPLRAFRPLVLPGQLGQGRAEEDDAQESDDDGGDGGQDLDDGLDDLPDPPVGDVGEVGGHAEADRDGDEPWPRPSRGGC